jgi:hypothetical protein
MVSRPDRAFVFQHCARVHHAHTQLPSASEPCSTRWRTAMPRKSVRVARVGLFGRVKPPSQIARAGVEFTPLYRFVHTPFVQSIARSVRQRAIPQGTRGGCYVVRPLCNCCTRYARPADVAALLDRCSTRRVDCDAGGPHFQPRVAPFRLRAQRSGMIQGRLALIQRASQRIARGHRVADSPRV